MLHSSLVVAAALVAAQTPSQQRADDPIIVEGQRVPTYEQAVELVSDITGTVESQLARYSGPVCPGW